MRNQLFHFPWFSRATPRACYVNHGRCISRRWIVFPLCLHTVTPSFFRLSHGLAVGYSLEEMEKTFPVCPQSASWHADREWWSPRSRSMTFVLPRELRLEMGAVSFLRDRSTAASTDRVRACRSRNRVGTSGFLAVRTRTIDRHIGWFIGDEVYFCGLSFQRFYNFLSLLVSYFRYYDFFFFVSFQVSCLRFLLFYFLAINNCT